MKRSLSLSLFLLLAFFMFTCNGLAQSGNPPPPPPPTGPGKTSVIDHYKQASVVLDGTLVVNNFDASADNKLGFVRNVARSLLQTDQMSVVYRTEGGDFAIGKLSDGDTAFDLVRYHKLALDAVTESFFDGVRDFLVTDGKKYFRIVLGTSEPKNSFDGSQRMAVEK